jgi:NDP-sugar pyrophosphorylase family protein
LKANDNFGMRIEVSREEKLLDTGGGLRQAAPFFSDNLQEPFFLHNVDVISTIDLGRMMRFHTEEKALATLAVQERESSRQLLFDEGGRLCGRRVGRGGEICVPRSQNRDLGHPPDVARPAKEAKALAFSGIHVVSPQIFAEMEGEGAFSIIDSYLRLAAQEEKIIAFRADEWYWRDLGRPESLAQAEVDLKSGRFSID